MGAVNPGVQILRGVAATLVLVHHALEESRAIPDMAWVPDWVVRAGACGVDLFFVISGLVIFLSAFSSAKGRRSPLAFVEGRVARIYPFYWFCMALVIALHATGGAFNRLHLDGATLVTSALLLPHDHHVIGVAWTLVYEVYFYAVVALVLLARWPARTSLAAMILAILAILLAARTLAGSGGATFLGSPIVLEFCFGAALALALGHLAARQASALLFPGGLLAGAALISAASALAPSDGTSGLLPDWRWLAWGLPSVLVVGVAYLTPLRASRATRLLVALGDASYAIYLTHIFVMIALARIIKAGWIAGSGWPATGAAVIVALVIGCLAHVWIEKPLTRLARSSLARTRPAAAAA